MHEPLPPDREPNGIPAAAVSAGLAARVALGTLRRGCGGRAGSVGAGAAYAGRGSDAYHPALLLSLLIYGYATGTHSNRRIERATYESLVFRFIACDQHPDHDTLANFRRRFGEQFARVFVQVLEVARENPALALWYGEPGRDQDSRQRQLAQRTLLWTRAEDRGSAQGRSAGDACTGRSG